MAPTRLLLPNTAGWRDMASTENVLCRAGAIAMLPCGDVLIFDRGDHRLKRAWKQKDGTFIISTIAGSGRQEHADGVGQEASFTDVSSIAVNPDGASCIVVGDTRIRAVDLVTGAIKSNSKDPRLRSMF